jgi:hypothetical protein
LLQDFEGCGLGYVLKLDEIEAVCFVGEVDGFVGVVGFG